MNRRSLPFRYRLTLVIVLFVLIPSVLVNLISFSIIKTHMSNEAKNWLSEVTKGSGKQVDIYIQLVEGLTKNPLFDSTLMDIFKNKLNNKEGWPGYLYDERVHIFGWLSMISEMDKNIIAAEFVDRQGNRFHLGKDIISAPANWLELTDMAGGKSVVWPPSAENQKFGRIFSVSRLINHPLDYNAIASIRVYFKLDFVENHDNTNFSQKGVFMILDQEGQVIFSTNSSFTNILDQANERSLFQEVYHSDITGWKMLGVVPANILFEKIDHYQKTVLIINMIFIAITIIVVFIFSSQLTAPLRKLSEVMHTAYRSDFTRAHFHTKRLDEIGMISISFNQMINKIQNLITKVTETELNRKNSEIIALQAQINPHFLYNSLHLITMQAELDENYKLSDMAAILAKLLRYSVGKNQEWVFVQQEVDHIAGYFRLMWYRFPFIEYEIEVDPQVKNWRIMRLILQPIVENSILHGVVPKGQKGSIRIAIRETATNSNRMLIVIQDNGAGMTAKEVVQLNNRLRMEKPLEEIGQSGGIGLKNVYDRISLSYGKDYSFRFESVEGEGTVFLIELPGGIKDEDIDR